MTPDRLIAAQAMRAQGMTLIQIAATLGVGRSSLVRALAQTTDSLAGAAATIAGPEQTVTQLPKPANHSAEPPTTSATEPATLPEVQLLWTGRRGQELEALTWPAGYSPACPSCAQPTTGLEEQYARVPGQRQPVIVALAHPCGCLVDEHATALQTGATIL